MRLRLFPGPRRRIAPGLLRLVPLLVAAATAGRLHAQIGTAPRPAGDPVSVRLAVPPEPVRRGEAFRLEIRFEPAPPYHLYGPEEKRGTPTRVEIEPEPGLTFGPPVYPPPAEKKVPGLDGAVAVYDKPFAVSVRAVPAPDAAPGGRTLRAKVSYMACTDETCLRPVSGRMVAAAVTVSDAPPASSPAAPERSGGPPDGGAAPAPAPGAGATGGSFLALLAACVAGGLVSLVMPCVYPLIPITLTYFLKQSPGSRWRGFALSSAYGAGILVSFTGLGLALSIALGARGVQDFAANPWVNLGVALLFLAFALSLFGLFEIGLPSGVTNALAARPQAGLAGAFLLGLSFSVVTFTCVLPIASNLFVLAATGSAARAAAGMLMYSGTMAAPFIAFGLFPSWLRSIPRSGGWMETAKVTMGFFELMLVAYYASKADWGWGLGALNRPVLLALWMALAAFAAACLFGWIQLRGHAEDHKPGVGRYAAGAAAAALLAVLLAGLAGRDLGAIEALLPPPADLTLGVDYEAGLREARETGRPLFVEFTGFT